MAWLCGRPQLASRDAWPDLDGQVGEVEEEVEEYYTLNYPVRSSFTARDEDSKKQKQNGKLRNEDDGDVGDLDSVRNLA